MALSDVMGGLSVKDVFNSYVGLETAKVKARMSATAAMQKRGLNAPSVAQQPQATTATTAMLLSTLSIKKIGIGLAGVGVLLGVLKIAKVI